MRKVFYLISILLLVPGCMFTGYRLTKQQAAYDTVNSQVLDQARYMTDTTVKSLLFETNRTPNISLAIDTSTEAQRLLGPNPVKQFDWGNWTNGDNSEIKKAINYDDDILAYRKELEAKLKKSTDNLVSKGIQYEQDHNKKVWWKFWTWSSATLFIAGFIALCIFTPAGPMVLGLIVRGITGLFPRLINTFGLASASTLSNTVKGIGNVRSILQVQEDLPTDKQPTYTPTEVRQMIDDQLKDSLSNLKDVKVIDHLRKVNNVD